MNKFKAGDRVKFTHDFVFHKDGMLNTITKGATGKVIEEYNAFYGDRYYSIKLDGNKDCYAGRVPVSIIKLISRNIAIKHIINDRATIVILPDGRKGVAKCHPDDEFDEYEGLRIATARAYGKDPFPKDKNNELLNSKFKVGDKVEFCVGYLPAGINIAITRGAKGTITKITEKYSFFAEDQRFADIQFDNSTMSITQVPFKYLKKVEENA